MALCLIYILHQTSGRIRTTKPQKRSQNANGYHYIEVGSDLTIKGVIQSDEGVYRCTVTNHDGKTNFAEESIYIHSKFS